VKGAIFTFILAAIAYHERDNFLSCLGCVTDWQQETRGLFLLANEGTSLRFYPQRRAPMVRISKHFRQAHSKLLSLGIAK